MEVTLMNHGKTKDILSIVAYHNKNFYMVSVRKEVIEETPDGSCLRMFDAVSENNFSFKIFEGRKSNKKLQKLENFLQYYAEYLLGLWYNRKYDEMKNFIIDSAKKIFIFKTLDIDQENNLRIEL